MCLSFLTVKSSILTFLHAAIIVAVVCIVLIGLKRKHKPQLEVNQFANPGYRPYEQGLSEENDYTPMDKSAVYENPDNVHCEAY